jgi:hypothetical protein
VASGDLGQATRLEGLLMDGLGRLAHLFGELAGLCNTRLRDVIGTAARW